MITLSFVIDRRRIWLRNLVLDVCTSKLVEAHQELNLAKEELLKENKRKKI